MKKNGIKKLLAVLLAASLTLSNTIALAAVSGSDNAEENNPASDGISIMLDGEKLSLDVKPQIINGRIMIPMREIFEALKADVEWNADKKEITAKSDIGTVIMRIGYLLMYVNGTPKLLDVAPQITDGVTMIPLRNISEAMGCNVNWDDSTQTASINNWESVWVKKLSASYSFAQIENLSDYNSKIKPRLSTIGIIENIKIRDISDNVYDSVIMATVKDLFENKWNVILSPLAEDENNRNSFDGFLNKSVIVLGEYYNVLEQFNNPILIAHKILDVTNGIKLIYHKDFDSLYPEIKSEQAKRTVYGAGGFTIEAPCDDDEMLVKLYLYNKPMVALFSESGQIKVVPESKKEKYTADEWFEESFPRIMYTWNNKLRFVKSKDYEQKKSDGWHDYPTVKMYAPDGRTTDVEECDIESFQNVGWFLNPVTTMYAPDGRTIDIEQSQVEDYLNVGWYISPVTTMYAPDGREIVIDQSEITEYENVGWYTKPVQYVYAPDGRAELIPRSDVNSWVNVGWYTDLFIGKPYVHNFKDITKNMPYVGDGDVLELRWDPVKNAIGYEIEIKSADGYETEARQYYEIVNAEGELVYTTAGSEVYNEKVRIRGFGLNRLGETVYGPWSDVRQFFFSKHGYTFRFDLLDWNHLNEVREALGVPNNNTIHTTVYKPFFIDNRYVIEVEFEKRFRRQRLIWVKALCDHYTGEILDIDSNY